MRAFALEIEREPSFLPGFLRGLLLLAGLLAACGYRFSAAGGPLPKGVTSVRVPVLRNRTAEAGFEAVLTEALRRELERTGHGSGGPADATLEGVVEAVSSLPLALKSAPPPGQTVLGPANPGLYQASVTVTVKLARGADLLAQVDHLTLSEPYLPADDLAVNEANRRLALRRLARALAREIVERLTAP